MNHDQTPTERDAAQHQLHQLLGMMSKQSASDLHLSAGLAPMLRIHGEMVFLPESALEPSAVEALVLAAMTAQQQALFAAQWQCDFAYEVVGVGRFRINAFMQQRGMALVARAIAPEILSLEALGAPSVLAALCDKKRGLVLITGASGMGKSTTLAAMVQHINQHQAAHIVTVEDPIEWVHQPLKSLISQREVGVHTHGFAPALSAALREDPDVILVGEMRDAATIRLALTAAETGHLVLGTLHTSSAAKAVDRIVDVFEAAEKELIRAMLSESLEAVVAQTLCKTADGKARVAAYEVMLGTTAIRHLIRDNKTAQMYSAMQMGASVGMQTLDQALLVLVHQGLITPEEARLHGRTIA